MHCSDGADPPPRSRPRPNPSDKRWAVLTPARVVRAARARAPDSTATVNNARGRAAGDQVQGRAPACRPVLSSARRGRVSLGSPSRARRRRDGCRDQRLGRLQMRVLGTARPSCGRARGARRSRRAAGTRTGHAQQHVFAAARPRATGGVGGGEKPPAAPEGGGQQRHPTPRAARAAHRRQLQHQAAGAASGGAAARAAAARRPAAEAAQGAGTGGARVAGGGEHHRRARPVGEMAAPGPPCDAGLDCRR